jgi:phospholipid transport system transporter-binding protein
MAAPGAAAFQLESAGDGRFRLAGVLSFETAAAVLAAGGAFAAAPRAAVDLAGVTHADSAGLAVLLTWLQAARAAGRRLVFEALPAPLARIARLCGVADMLDAANGA